MLHSAKQKKYNQTSEFASTRSKNEESLLVSKYLYLVHGAIKKMGYINSLSDTDDMQQVGLITLLNMIRRFPIIEDEKEFIRLTYIRIRGSILDEIRSRDWRPADKRQIANKFSQYENKLAQKLGREPTKAEMIAITDLTEEEYEEGSRAINSRSFTALSDELLTVHDNENSSDITRHVENKQCLEVALKALSQEEVLILHLMYEKEMSFKEIALATDNNFSRINKIQRDAHSKLTYLVTQKGGLTCND